METISRLSDATAGALTPRWGVVTSLSPLTVKLDADRGEIIEPSKVCSPNVGDRVLCLRWGVQTFILGVVGGDMRGRSGTISHSTPSWSQAGGMWVGYVDLDLPYTPPDGWTFIPVAVSTNGYVMFSTASADPTVTGKLRVRAMTPLGTTTWTSTRWQLVPA